MATQLPHTGPVGPDTLITVKVAIEGTNRRFKLALRDLGAHALPQKVCLPVFQPYPLAAGSLRQPVRLLIRLAASIPTCSTRRKRCQI